MTGNFFRPQAGNSLSYSQITDQGEHLGPKLDSPDTNGADVAERLRGCLYHRVRGAACELRAVEHRNDLSHITEDAMRTAAVLLACCEAVQWYKDHQIDGVVIVQSLWEFHVWCSRLACANAMNKVVPGYAISGSTSGSYLRGSMCHCHWAGLRVAFVISGTPFGLENSSQHHDAFSQLRSLFVVLTDRLFHRSRSAFATALRRLVVGRNQEMDRSLGAVLLRRRSAWTAPASRIQHFHNKASSRWVLMMQESSGKMRLHVQRNTQGARLLGLKVVVHIATRRV